MFELAEANEQASIALENALHLLLILRETLFGEAQEQPETPENPENPEQGGEDDTIGTDFWN